MENIQYLDPSKRNGVNPQIFALWLGICGITMMFAALTSAYLVRKGAGNWLEFHLPSPFYFSTGAIILSSITLYFSSVWLKEAKFGLYKLGLILTFVLGIVFIYLQISGWKIMYSHGLDIKVNPSASFLYAIPGLHILHVIGGLICLIVAIIHAFFLPNKVSEKRLFRLKLTSQYWHFVGLLWVYLLIFFYIEQP